MELGRRKLGELVALVGVVLGFIALWTEAVDGSGVSYADDGTVMAAGIIILGLAACCLLGSLLLGMTNLDLTAAVAGAVAWGFFLFQPASFAFKSLDMLGTGAWLGVVAGLVPLGAAAAVLSQRRMEASGQGVTLATAAAGLGLLLIVIAIWSEVVDGGLTYWEGSASGHTLGLLLLLLAIVSAALIAMAATSRRADLADIALIVSAVLVGVAVAEGVHDAFGSLGDMATGGWLALIGGLLLLLALVGSRVVKLAELKK